MHIVFLMSTKYHLKSISSSRTFFDCQFANGYNIRQYRFEHLDTRNHKFGSSTICITLSEISILQNCLPASVAHLDPRLSNVDGYYFAHFCIFLKWVSFYFWFPKLQLVAVSEKNFKQLKQIKIFIVKIKKKDFFGPENGCYHAFFYL